MSKNDFKTFARSHPELASSVNSGKTNWQNLYQLYDIYGENSNVWNSYFSSDRSSTLSNSIQKASNSETSSKNPTSISDVINMIKKVDLETVQKGVTNLQKTIGLLQDLGLGGVAGAAAAANTPKTYEARPMYKYFED